MNYVLDIMRTSCRARLRLHSGAAARSLLLGVTFLVEEAEFGLTACDDSGPGVSRCAGTSFPRKLLIVAIAAVATRVRFTDLCCEALEFRVRQGYGMPTVFRLSHRPMRPEDAGIHTCIRCAVRPIRRDGAFLLPRMAASLPSAETMEDLQGISRQLQESVLLIWRSSLLAKGGATADVAATDVMAIQVQTTFAK